MHPVYSAELTNKVMEEYTRKINNEIMRQNTEVLRVHWNEISPPPNDLSTTTDVNTWSFLLYTKVYTAEEIGIALEQERKLRIFNRIKDNIKILIQEEFIKYTENNNALIQDEIKLFITSNNEPLLLLLFIIIIITRKEIKLFITCNKPLLLSLSFSFSLYLIYHKIISYLPQDNILFTTR